MAPGFGPAGQPRAVGEVEQLLGAWFGRPVVLASSGRAAMLLALRELGLNRYRDRIAVSPMTAACVFDAVIRAGFPVDPAAGSAGPVSASLLIHQFGHLQRARLAGRVVEDIAHAFFASPACGTRNWASDRAIFSLPKFFVTAGMAGGLAVEDETLAERLRALRDSAPAPDPQARAIDRARLGRAAGPELEEIYLRLLLHPAPDPEALAGLPASLEAIAAVGQSRAERAELLLAAIPPGWLPDDWRAMAAGSPPFALPVFAGPAIDGLVAELHAMGVHADRYQLDVARNCTAPQIEPAVLLPCHHAIPLARIEAIADLLRNASARAEAGS